MDVRRVVTGHDGDGNAVVVSDELVAPTTMALLPGSEFHLLWGSDQPASFPDDGSRPDSPRYFPPVGGFRFGFFTIPPAGATGLPADLDLTAAIEEFNEKLVGMTGLRRARRAGHAHHGHHRLRRGAVRPRHPRARRRAPWCLGPGDTYIQNGTRHRW